MTMLGLSVLGVFTFGKPLSRELEHLLFLPVFRFLLGCQPQGIRLPIVRCRMSHVGLRLPIFFFSDCRCRIQHILFFRNIFMARIQGMAQGRTDIPVWRRYRRLVLPNTGAKKYQIEFDR